MSVMSELLVDVFVLGGARRSLVYHRRVHRQIQNRLRCARRHSVISYSMQLSLLITGSKQLLHAGFSCSRCSPLSASFPPRLLRLFAHFYSLRSRFTIVKRASGFVLDAKTTRAPQRYSACVLDPKTTRSIILPVC